VTLEQIPLTEALYVLRLQNDTIDQPEARIVTGTLCVLQTETLDRLERRTVTLDHIALVMTVSPEKAAPPKSTEVAIHRYFAVHFQIEIWVSLSLVRSVTRLRHVDQEVPVCYSVLQCVAVCCSALQCAAVCCSELPRVAVSRCRSVLQCVAVCCVDQEVSWKLEPITLKQSRCVRHSID